MLRLMQTMVVEIARLLLGVLIAVFHRPLACKIMQHERVLDGYFTPTAAYISRNLPAIHKRRICIS